MVCRPSSLFKFDMLNLIYSSKFFMYFLCSHKMCNGNSFCVKQALKFIRTSRIKVVIKNSHNRAKKTINKVTFLKQIKARILKCISCAQFIHELYDTLIYQII